MGLQGLRRRAGLLEGAQLESGLENPADPLLERRVHRFGSEFAPPAAPGVLERPAVEVAIDAQPAFVPVSVALPHPVRRIGAGMRDGGHEAASRTQERTNSFQYPC